MAVLEHLSALPSHEEEKPEPAPDPAPEPKPAPVQETQQNTQANTEPQPQKTVAKAQQAPTPKVVQQTATEQKQPTPIQNKNELDSQFFSRIQSLIEKDEPLVVKKRAVKLSINNNFFVITTIPS